MIEVDQLHDALRFSGLAPDVPFHAIDSSHELKLRKVLTELDLPESGTIEGLKEEIARLESENEGLERDLKDADRENDAKKSDIYELEQKLAKLESAS